LWLQNRRTSSSVAQPLLQRPGQFHPAGRHKEGAPPLATGEGSSQEPQKRRAEGEHGGDRGIPREGRASPMAGEGGGGGAIASGGGGGGGAASRRFGLWRAATTLELLHACLLLIMI
jgi:hypothetical protein